MKENSIKFKLNRNGKEIEISGEIMDDNTITRMGKPILCDCTGDTPETATGLIYTDGKVVCPECGKESVSVYTFKDYEADEMDNLHLNYFATDYLTLQKLYKVSYTLPYESWKLVEDLFMKLSPEDVDLGEFIPYNVGWVTSNPELVEERLGIKPELRICNQVSPEDKLEKENLQLEVLDELLEEFSIMETPESPDGLFELDGIVIDNPFNPPNDYGGGEYFVVTPEYIWFVRMNSGDNDNWDFNNIKVKGTYGGIGKRIPYTEELEDKVNLLKE